MMEELNMDSNTVKFIRKYYEERINSLSAEIERLKNENEDMHETVLFLSKCLAEKEHR